MSNQSSPCPMCSSNNTSIAESEDNYSYKGSTKTFLVRSLICNDCQFEKLDEKNSEEISLEIVNFEKEVDKKYSNVVQLHLAVDNNNEIDLDDLDEDEIRDIIIQTYMNVREMFIGLIDNDYDLYNALARLKESFNWALGVLSDLDSGHDEEEYDEDE